MRNTAMKIILALLVSMILLVAMVPKEHAIREAGPVILVGGGSIPAEAIERFKERKLKGGRFVIVSYNKSQHDRWKSLDPIFVLPERITGIPLHKVGGIVIEGGDQWIYLNTLSGKYIQDAHELGIPILGTSAGSMILGEHYFSAECDSITSEQAKENVNVCLGRAFVHIKWLKDVIIDTHFMRRNRQGRLEVFVSKSGAAQGFGIDEQTALYVDATHFDIMGEGTVTIVKKTTMAPPLPISIDAVAKTD